MRTILAYGCRVGGDDLKTMLPSMVSEKPIKNKEIILKYLKSFPAGPSGLTYCKDPLTGKIFADGNTMYNDGEFKWNTKIIYMFEHYNMKLCDDFTKQFD